MNKKYISYFIISFLWSLMLQAQDGHLELFQQADASMLKANYQDAINKYEEIEAMGLESSDLYFNRARSHFELEEHVLALVYLERCLKIDPEHENALLAQSGIINQLENPIVQYQDEGLKQKWTRYFQFLSANTWSYLFLFSLFLFLLLNYLDLKSVINVPRWLNWFLGFLSLLFFVNAWSISSAEISSDFGLVNVKSANIFSTADLESTVKNEVTEAQKLKILDDIAEWYKIQLPNRETGWILKDQLISI